MKLKVSAVSYLNTIPFIYGLEHSNVKNEIDLSLDIPSECARKLIDDEVDLGLVPVAILPQLEEYYLVSDYCIAANKKVNSVFLFSDVPLKDIKTVLLDYQSRTSVNLVKVLADRFWKLPFKWEQAEKGYENQIHEEVAGVVIGDRTFELSKKFKYKIDLAEAWYDFTNLPFTFACWVSKKPLPEKFIEHLNEAFSFGLNKVEEAVEKVSSKVLSTDQLLDYLSNDIDYKLTKDKEASLKLFLSYLKDSVPSL